jgi:hypothetical protein
LHGAHPADCLFSFDAFLFTGLQDLLVLNPEFATLDIKSIEGGDDSIGINSLAEVGKGKAAEGALLIEMIIEGIRGGDGQRRLSKER